MKRNKSQDLEYYKNILKKNEKIEKEAKSKRWYTEDDPIRIKIIRIFN